MTTDNRTNEPSEAQVDAAAKALAGIPQETPWSSCEVWGDLDEWVEGYRSKARAALEAAARAAQGAAPQAATAHSPVHFECDCVPNLGPPHCHACSDEIGNPVMWSACPNAVPVQPSSTVDVEKVIDALVMTDLSDYAGTDMGMIRSAARAVVEAIRGESRG